ncbi:MAG: F0F1 ATP synthase subunit B [Chitinophagales bacterium]|mgnify:CR=1 FL=1|jgi:F-type H+-transporting ATPase subunit b|nr:F0F1 ATP synthase subunit B [Chitinophagales bacterium]
MDLLLPDLGLFFWTAIIFLIILFLLTKFAWKPVVKMLNERSEGINQALKSAEAARAEMANLTADNQRILNEAKEEKSRIIKEAKDAAEKLRTMAADAAKADAAKILADAKREIENQKNAAMMDIKNQIGTLATEVAEKMIRKELKKDGEQMNYVNSLVNEMKLN